MNYESGKTILIALIVLRVFQVLITFLSGYHSGNLKKAKEKRIYIWPMMLVDALALNGIFMLLMHRVFYGDFNLAMFFQRILAGNITYKYLENMAFMTFLGLAFALLCGIASGLIIRRYMSEEYVPHSFSAIKIVCIALLSITMVSASVYAFSLAEGEKTGIKINEIQSIKTEVPLLGETKYIELINAGDFCYDAHNLYLSNKDKEPYKLPVSEEGFIFGKDKVDVEVLTAYSEGIIRPGDHVLIPVAKEYFKLKKDGDQTIYLFSAGDLLLDEVYVPERTGLLCYARIADGEDTWDFASCTPGTDNAEATLLSQRPAMSAESGVYEKSFALYLTAGENSKIYYTLDGSTPTEASTLYTEPIFVYNRSSEASSFFSHEDMTIARTSTADYTYNDKATVVRAISVDENGKVSEVVTNTYLVGLSGYEDCEILSIVTDSEFLFGENGIYVTGKEYDDWVAAGSPEEDKKSPNFLKRGREWEIPAYMQLFGGETEFAQYIGMRISGSSSARKILKRFAIYARDEYSGSDTFDVELFESIRSHKLGIRDGKAEVYLQDLFSDRAVTTALGRKVVLFVNGEKITDTYIVEKYDTTFFKEHYDINEENLIVYRGDKSVTEGETDEEERKALFSFAKKNDMSIDENYEKLCEMMDMQSYVDYMAIRVYIDDIDFAEEKNNLLWKSKTVTDKPYEDGKWRWGLYDLDSADWLNENGRILTLKRTKEDPFTATTLLPYTVIVNEQTLFKSLRKSDKFCELFVTTMYDMINDYFTMERIKECMDKAGVKVDLIGYFYENRPLYFEEIMRNEFGLTGQLREITVSVNDAEAGQIGLNTLTLSLAEGEWTGTYFDDYEVTLTALPNEGYHFVKWEGFVNSSETTVKVKLGEENKVRAVFEKD